MSNKTVLFRLLKYLSRAKFRLLGAFICTLITVLLSLATPLLIGRTIDNIEAGKVILPLVIALSVVYAANPLFTWVNTYLLNKITQITINKLRGGMMDKIGKLPMKAFDTTPHGEFVSRLVNDADVVADGLLQGLLSLMSGVLSILGAVIFMLFINPLMTLVVLASAPAAYYVARFITKSTQKYFKEQAGTVGKLNALSEEVISGHKTVCAFGLEEEQISKFKALNNELHKVGVNAQFYSSLTNPMTRVVNNVTYAVVGVIGALAAIYQGLSVGNIASFLIYAGLFAKPFNEITGVLSQVQAALASASRVFSILDLPEEEDGSKELQNAEGTVSFHNVAFSYKPEQKLIEHFSLTVSQGEKIAIVGRTGAGKTTLVNLLMRFYDVQAGEIRVGGTDIKTLTRDSLRQNFGIVLQDTWLFGGTVRDNIAYSRPEASFDEIVSAAVAAEAHSFIKKLSHGYDTKLSEAGDSISAGQKQLLTIARVMLANPPILILDEATSNIDTLTESKIQRALDRLMKGKTSFIIAHRLSTIRNADCIIVLDEGKIVETGDHSKLLSKGGVYAAMVRSRQSENEMQK